MSYFNSNNPYPPITGDYMNVQPNNNTQQQQQQSQPQQQSSQNQNGNANAFNGLLSAPTLQGQITTTSPLNSYNYMASGANGNNNNSNNQRLQSPGILFNNLAMSSTIGSDNSSSNNNYTNSSAASSYQSLALSSPQSSNISLFSNHRAKFMSSKGFDIDDDLEFCPEIVNAKRFNPYTSSSFSPTSTLINTVNHSNTSPDSNNNSMMATPTPVGPNRPSSPSPRVFTPRAKKILEIVNPTTGMKIGSPTTGHATISPIK